MGQNKSIGMWLASGALFGGCTATATTSSNQDAALLEAFPAGVTVAAPTGLDSGDDVAKVDLLHRLWDVLVPDAAAATTSASGAFAATTKRINAILSGSTALGSAPFHPQQYLRPDDDAGCYGPQMDVKNHPDDPSAPARKLPSGDLGLWSATDAATGDACVAAQWNARMRGATARTSQTLIGLAMVAKQAYATSGSLPAVGATTDVTTSMPVTPKVTWQKASVSQPTAGKYDYLLYFDFQDAAGATHHVETQLHHEPGADATHYTGSARYAVTHTFVGGNCPGTGAKDVTTAGTILYTRTGESDIEIAHRSGQFCGAATTHGTLATDRGATYAADGQLDPTAKLDGTGKGWGDKFARFGAHVNPNTGDGSYLLAWQAGPQDGSARVLEGTVVQLAAAAAGEGYFGFGGDITTFSGDINGMICNWAGPGSSHTVQPYFQRQAYSQSGSTWASEATPSISYAPKNDCVYGGSDIWYDRNGNGAFDETAADETVATTDATFLAGKGTAASVAAAIAARGYTKPATF